MKFLSGTLMVAVTLVAACTKKDTPVGPVTPVVNNTKPTAASISQQTLTFYPYTDTFVGSMATYLVWGYEGAFHNTDTACMFLITHLDSQHCVIQSLKPVQVEQYGAIVINDSITISRNGIDSGNIFIPFGDRPATDRNAVIYCISSSSLTANWDITVPIVGVCDWDESKGQFTGAFKQKNR